MPSNKKQRPTHKTRTTPKGEAGDALEHATSCLRELEALSVPSKQKLFVGRLNDFISAARRAVEYLPKEAGRDSQVKSWTRQEHENLIGSDPRYKYFCALRAISIHDCIVQPDKAEHIVEVTESIRFSGYFETDVLDPETGKPGGHVIYDGPAGADGIHEQRRVRTKYFFADWQQEDIVTFCGELLTTLQGLINKAYQLYP
jgi:hypothetical protein